MKKINQKINERAQLVKTRNYFLSVITQPDGSFKGDSSLLGCAAQSVKNVYKHMGIAFPFSNLFAF